jgi:hypothetical protein
MGFWVISPYCNLKVCAHLNLEIWRQDVPPKRLHTRTTLHHGVMTQTLFYYTYFHSVQYKIE